jgi:hypothetical protein
MTTNIGNTEARFSKCKVTLSHTVKNIMAVISSTKKYLEEITEEHSRQCPFRQIQLNMGIFSNHERTWPQTGQCDDGANTDSSLGILHIQTFRKLPTQAPVIKTKTFHSVIVSGIKG